jgi:hypothetical protein
MQNTTKKTKYIDPHRYLCEHVFRGDSGDGVPNVLSGDRVFTEGGRQTPLSAKKIDAWYSAAKAGTLESAMPAEAYRNYIRNSKVIDLSCIPDEIKESILTVYSSLQKKGNSKVFNYLVSKRCNQLTSCAEEFFTYK